MRKLSVLCAGLCCAFSLFSGCSKNNAQNRSIAVFVPGIIADSPTYEDLANGVSAAVEQHNESAAENAKVSLYIMEAGTNQAEWLTKMTALCADGSYDVIISSNESIPELADQLTKKFPAQKFLLLHGKLEGNKNIACVNYNQKEQAYLLGYISGLMSRSHKTALISAQEYPAMNTIIYPNYAKGAADSGSSCEMRIVGNWYDAAKGAEITDALAATGVDVILPICGGAAQGVIASAKERGLHLVFTGGSSFEKAPGTIVALCQTQQKTASREVTNDYLNGKVQWGTTREVGLSDGYIRFIDDHPLYISSVPEDVRAKMDELLKEFASGKGEKRLVSQAQ